MPRLPVVLSSRDLPLAELHAAVLDGELYRLDRCFSPVDEIDQSTHRALALATEFPIRLIAERHTAAWILGAIDHAPAIHEFCADIASRSRPGGLVAARIREVVIDSEDVTTCSGVSLTTPLRTVLDLARAPSDFRDEDYLVVLALLRIGHLGLAQVASALDRRSNLPNKRVALERVREALRRRREMELAAGLSRR